MHALTTTPDAGIFPSVLDLRERQVIQFPRDGRFTVTSGDPAHPAVLRVTVTGSCGLFGGFECSGTLSVRGTHDIGSKR